MTVRFPGSGKRLGIVLACLAALVALPACPPAPNPDPDTDPLLSVTPLNLDYSLNESVRSFSVANSGGGVLTWSATSSEPWLSLDKNGGVGPAAVMVTVNRSAIPKAYADTTVNVTSNGGDAFIEVSVLLQDPPPVGSQPYWPLGPGHEWVFAGHGSQEIQMRCVEQFSMNNTPVWRIIIETRAANGGIVSTATQYLVYRDGFLCAALDTAVLNNLAQAGMSEKDGFELHPLVHESPPTLERMVLPGFGTIRYAQGELASFLPITYGDGTTIARSDIGVADQSDCLAQQAELADGSFRTVHLFARGVGPVVFSNRPLKRAILP